MHIHPSSRFPAILIPIVLAFSMAPVPALGADTSKSPVAAPEIEADLVLEGAAIYTVDPARTWAEAVAIRGDEILYVGGSKGAAQNAGVRCR